jgi:hypothetical protein
MARRRRARKTTAKAARCKTVTVNGRRRRMCWTAKGKIKSNKPA